MRPTVKKLLKQKGYGPIFQAIDNSKRQFKQMRYSRGEIQDTLIGMFGSEDPKILRKIKEEKVNEASVSQVRSTLSRVKKQLMKKWAKKGGYENFGQKELRALKSKFKENPYGSPQERQISKMLGAFNNWAMNYSGDMRESVNEMTTSQARDTLNHLGGKRFIVMTGAKPLTIDKKRKELLFKIGRNAKGINLVTIRLTSLDLYDMEFAQVRMGNKKVKAVEKRVYGDQLQKFFKKHTGMNTYL
jgi:hypothetical protein